MSNAGAGATTIRAYDLIATSDQQATADRGTDAPVIDLKALGYATYAVPAGYAGRRLRRWSNSPSRPGSGKPMQMRRLLDLYLDYDGDGFADANVFNYEVAGRPLGRTQPDLGVGLLDGCVDAYFFTEHQTNSAKIFSPCVQSRSG